MDVNIVSIILCVLAIIVVAFGFYRMANRSYQDTKLLRTADKVSRQTKFNTILIVLGAIVGLAAIMFVFSNL